MLLTFWIGNVETFYLRSIKIYPIQIICGHILTMWCNRFAHVIPLEIVRCPTSLNVLHKTNMFCFFSFIIKLFMFLKWWNFLKKKAVNVTLQAVWVKSQCRICWHALTLSNCHCGIPSGYGTNRSMVGQTWRTNNQTYTYVVNYIL